MWPCQFHIYPSVAMLVHGSLPSFRTLIFSVRVLGCCKKLGCWWWCMGQETWRHLITGSTIPGPAKVRAGSRVSTSFRGIFQLTKLTKPSIGEHLCGLTSQLPKYYIESLRDRRCFHAFNKVGEGVSRKLVPIL